MSLTPRSTGEGAQRSKPAMTTAMLYEASIAGSQMFPEGLLRTSHQGWQLSLRGQSKIRMVSIAKHPGSLPQRGNDPGCLAMDTIRIFDCPRRLNCHP